MSSILTDWPGVDPRTAFNTIFVNYDILYSKDCIDRISDFSGAGCGDCPTGFRRFEHKVTNPPPHRMQESFRVTHFEKKRSLHSSPGLPPCLDAIAWAGLPGVLQGSEPASWGSRGGQGFPRDGGAERSTRELQLTRQSPPPVSLNFSDFLVGEAKVSVGGGGGEKFSSTYLAIRLGFRSAIFFKWLSDAAFPFLLRNALASVYFPRQAASPCCALCPAPFSLILICFFPSGFVLFLILRWFRCHPSLTNLFQVHSKPKNLFLKEGVARHFFSPCPIVCRIKTVPDLLGHLTIHKQPPPPGGLGAA